MSPYIYVPVIQEHENDKREYVENVGMECIFSTCRYVRYMHCTYL